jgi:hypothetical protein
LLLVLTGMGIFVIMVISHVIKSCLCTTSVIPHDVLSHEKKV